ncbi:hypothetical protein JOE11_003245 [Robbsia andropogonis]|uniref:DUF3592 domain-containing protein n=1 Tax=Robbsia andropogonis TaxID=28092 RepID=UPI003D1C8EC6
MSVFHICFGNCTRKAVKVFGKQLGREFDPGPWHKLIESCNAWFLHNSAFYFDRSVANWLVSWGLGRPQLSWGKTKWFCRCICDLRLLLQRIFLLLGRRCRVRKSSQASVANAGAQLPSVTATIEAHRVDSFSVRGRATSWRPVWLYSYDVDGVRYRVESDTLRGGYSASSYTSKDIAEENAETRPVGSKVLAYYNPQNPKQSVLDRRYDGPHFDFGLSLLMFIIAAPCLFLTSMACVLWSRLSSPAGI